MRVKVFKLLLIVTLLLLSNGDLSAQYSWTKYAGNPVIPSGPSGSWYRGVITPCVLYNADSSRYEMWFAGSPTTTGLRPHKIGFAYSSDGISWQVRNTAVLEPRAGNWDNYTVNAPYVIRENNQYKMWYTAEGPNYTTFKIGYAASPDGINWTRLDYPVMEAGTAEWEAQGVGICCVVPAAGEYKMWYTGLAGSTDTISIGYATSPDGINWQRDTTNNPVLRPGTAGQWDDFNIFAPRVINLDNLYYMYYGASRQTFAQYRVGLATSTNGINWVKYWDNPVLRPSPSGWDNSEIETAVVIKMGDTLKAWYDGSKSGTYVWQIGLATSPYLPGALPPGTYTIGTGGNFETIQETFDRLSTFGVAGNVTMELLDDLYVAPTDSFGFKLNGPIPGAGANSRVIIKPALNKNVTIEGDGQAVFYMVNTSYVTFDGIALTGPTTLTIHALQNPGYVYNDALDFIDNSDHNIIRNVTFIVEDITRASGFGFWYNQPGLFAPDSNLIQNNFIKKAGVAIFVVSPSSIIKAKGNIIKGNHIGSETDSLVAYGIQVYQNENTIIENNIIQNLKVTISGADNLTAGIVSSVCSGTIIRNNVIHNLKGISGFTSSGIVLYGVASSLGNDNQVYNNMIYDIHSTSNQLNSRVAGIQMSYQTNPGIYYNSVFLSGTGSNQLGSAAFYIHTGCTNIDAKNNIFVNTRDESPSCASAIYDYSASNLISDYNNLYYDDTNNYNCLVRSGGNDYQTLGEWQMTGKDLNSYVEMPNFVEPYLHISETNPTYLESRGTPIAGIDTDFDGDPRSNDSTDIGADEFVGIKVTGVEDEETPPREFALKQNYPNPFNPSTVISYQLPVANDVTLIVYDILGNKITTLVNEFKSVGRYEVEFNAAKLSSGVYFYQLRAGNYTNIKKMLLLK